jgi:hypothetical protein
MITHPDTAVRWVEEYNPVLDSWTTKAPMLYPSGFGVCGVVGGKIYVIGGVRANNLPIESCEVYDPVLNQWQRRKRLPTRRYEFNGGVIGESIYVAGGFIPNPSPGFYSDTMEVYNAARDSWFVRQSMNFPRVEFGSTVCNNKLYAIGGYYFNYQNVNEEYDPVQDTWHQKRPLPLERSGLACAAISNRVFAIGGHRYQPRTIYARVERYNITTDSWSIVESLNVARVYAGAVTMNDHIYVIGGLGRNGAPLATLEEYTTAPGIEDPEDKRSAYFGVNITIFPNPFKHQTTIQFSKLYGNKKTIKIYNLSGEVVKTIKNTGSDNRVVWFGTDESSRRLASGVYFAQVLNELNQTSICATAKASEGTRLIKLIILR